MGRRGPLPTPNAVRVLQGNPGKRPLRPEPARTAAGVVLEPPAHLSAPVAAVWRELGDVLGPLQPSDAPALEVLSNLVSEYRQDPPAMRVTRVAVLVQLLSRFGGTPSDRARLGVDEKPATVNPFEEFVGGNR